MPTSLSTTQNNKVLLTGASGFLGQVLLNKLIQTFTVLKLARNNNVDLNCDLSASIPSLSTYFSYVIHVAGKAHQSPRNYEECEVFNSTNYIGTVNLLTALEKSPPKTFIFISSVAVYGLDAGDLVNEESPLLGAGPYALSKLKAEKYIIDWCIEKSVRCLILRIPLVVGANPPGNLGKMIQAIRRKMYIRIGNGAAKKSAVLATDVANLIGKYLLSDKLPGGIYNLTDGLHPTLFEIEESIRLHYHRPPMMRVSIKVAKFLGHIGDLIPIFPINSNTIKKLTSSLTFDDAKARTELGWTSTSVLSFYK